MECCLLIYIRLFYSSIPSTQFNFLNLLTSIDDNQESYQYLVLVTSRDRMYTLIKYVL